MDKLTWIEKERTGQLTASEKTELTHWLNQSQENQEEFLNLNLLLDHQQITAPELQHNSLQAIKARIQTLQHENYAHKMWLRIAIACAMIAGVTFLFLWLPTNKTNHQQLIFNHASLSEVIDKLKSKRAIEIVTGPIINTCLFTGSLSSAGTEEDIIHTLSIALHLTFKKSSQNQYILIQTRCHQADNPSPQYNDA
jgi:hypothetical protein